MRVDLALYAHGIFAGMCGGLLWAAYTFNHGLPRGAWALPLVLLVTGVTVMRRGRHGA